MENFYFPVRFSLCFLDISPPLSSVHPKRNMQKSLMHCILKHVGENSNDNSWNIEKLLQFSSFSFSRNVCFFVRFQHIIRCSRLCGTNQRYAYAMSDKNEFLPHNEQTMADMWKAEEWVINWMLDDVLCRRFNIIKICSIISKAYKLIAAKYSFVPLPQLNLRQAFAFLFLNLR